MRHDLGLRHVADVLAVDLCRHRPVAPEQDPVEVMAPEDVGGAGSSAESLCRESRDRPGSHRDGRDDVEPSLEGGGGRDPQPEAPGVRVRGAVGDEGERGAAEPLDLERRLIP